MFSNQCKPVQNQSTLPPFIYKTDNRINDIPIQEDKILSLIRNIDPKKAHGPDNITGQILRLCDESIVLPLKHIFTEILKTSTYSNAWKHALYKKVYKKMTNNLSKIIDQYPYDHYVEKSLSIFIVT